MIVDGTLGYVLGGFVVLIMGLLYLGIGTVAASICESVNKSSLKKRDKPPVGLSRREVWAVTLGWPLIVGIFTMFVVWCIAVIATIVVVVLGIIAEIIGTLVFMLVAVVFFAVALGIILLLAFLIASPFIGISAMKNILTRFSPLERYNKTEDAESDKDEPTLDSDE